MIIRVLVVQNHTTTREAWRVLLECENDIEVCGEAEDGHAALDLVRSSQPNIVVMETVLPRLNGVDAARQIRAEIPQVKLVGLSVHHDRFMGRMMEAGASAYVGKSDTHGSLVEAVRQVQAGNQYVSPELLAAFAEYLRNPKVEKWTLLTPREREVLQLTAEGKKSPEIALMLVKSEPTVRSQVRSVKKKLGLQSEAALIKFAIQEGITSPHP